MWKNFVKRFACLRGVAAAFALLSILPNYYLISKWEILRAVHAAILSWNKLASWVGERIGEIPFLPQLSESQVNIFIITTSIVWPGWYSVYRAAKIAETPSQRKFIPTLLIFSALSSITLYILFIAGGNSFFDLWLTGNVAIFFLVAIINMPAYRTGVIFVIGLLVTFELLYFINVPSVRKAVNEFSCKAAKLATEEC